MSYIIKDNKQQCWLNIDRVVVGCDIITAVEPVYNYKAATEFSTEEIADQMIEQIKSEGQYDVEGYTKENKDALDMAERNAKEEKEKKVEAIRKAAQDKVDKIIEDGKANGLTDEQIQEELSKGILITEDDVK